MSEPHIYVDTNTWTNAEVKGHESNLYAACRRLEETVHKAREVANELIAALEPVLQPEAPPSEMKTAGGSGPDGLPTSPTVSRIDEQSAAIDKILRRLKGAMDRLDT